MIVPGGEQRRRVAEQQRRHDPGQRAEQGAGSDEHAVARGAPQPDLHGCGAAPGPVPRARVPPRMPPPAGAGRARSARSTLTAAAPTGPPGSRWPAPAPMPAASDHASSPVTRASQVGASVSTTFGGVPRVCRGPSMHCTAPNGGTRTSVECPGLRSAELLQRPPHGRGQLVPRERRRVSPPGGQRGAAGVRVGAAAGWHGPRLPSGRSRVADRARLRRRHPR